MVILISPVPPMFTPWISTKVHFGYRKTQWKKYQIRKFADWFRSKNGKEAQADDVRIWLDLVAHGIKKKFAKSKQNSFITFHACYNLFIVSISMFDIF